MGENTPPVDSLDATTWTAKGKSARASQAGVPCLTILCHAEISRIGERALLAPLVAGQPASVSRQHPLFVPVGEARGRPLEDPFLSRSPLRIQPLRGGGLRLVPGDQPLRVGEVVVDAPHDVTPDGLAEGVVLELAGRVVLLLHQTASPVQTPIEGIVGASDAIALLRQEIARVADLDVSVLVRGETGAGKERVAQAIHACSGRAEKECVAVNMAALAESVAASTLFGHARGAFTGAQSRHRGLLERASGGTLFLDEIGDTPESVQPMLLRAIETGRVLPLGDEEERDVSLRIVAATDQDLESDVEGGSFRAALLHRLAGYEIQVPPLRARRDDIARLLLHFLREERAAAGEDTPLGGAPSDDPPCLAPEIVLRLVQHPLPGNARQLRNIARHLVIANRGKPVLALEPSVERLLARERPLEAPKVPKAPSGKPGEITPEALLAALEKTGWSPGRAAAALGVATSTLHDLMRKCPGVRRAADVPDEELDAAFQATGGDTEQMAERLKVSERALKLTLRQRRLSE